MRMSERQPDGATLRDHLAAAASAGARPDPSMITPEVPRCCMTIVAAFGQLSAARPAGMGMSAIPPTEIDAWQRLYGLRLTPWELDTLTAMDGAAMSVYVESERKRSRSGAR